MYCYIHRSVNHSTLPEKFLFALSGQHVDSKTLECSALNGSLYYTPLGSEIHMEDGVGRLQELEVVGGFKEVVFSRNNRADAHELTVT